jgi:arsenate reductase (thioredoxin)
LDPRKTVLILCSRNSARSQMAEGILRKLVGVRFKIYSAGLNPDRIHSVVEPVMNEIGIDILGQYSKSAKEYLGKVTQDYVIFVCARAERNCPKIYPGIGERLSWPFDDPVAVEGIREISAGA